MNIEPRTKTPNLFKWLVVGGHDTRDKDTILLKTKDKRRQNNRLHSGHKSTDMS